MMKLIAITTAGMLVALSAAPSISDAAAPADRMAQAMVPPTASDDATAPMPMPDHMQQRFPQPVRVGALIGLPVLDSGASTLGHVRAVIRSAPDKITLVISYSRWFGWFGWFTHPVAVPIEVFGIEGRQLVSLDMAADKYAAAPTWHGSDAAELPGETVIRIALGRN